MKTLLLAPELFASNGGIPRILRLYLKALCDLAGPGDKVSFIALNDAVADSIDLRRYSTDRLLGWETCRGNKLRFIRAALRESRRTDLIVCGHVAQLPVARLARWMNPKLRYTLVAHGIEVWRSFTFAEKISLRGAHQIWCVSDFTRRDLLTRSRLRPDRVSVLSNGLDPYFTPAASAPDPAAGQGVSAEPSSSVPIILAVSRLDGAERYKGVDHLIEALPAIREAIPNAELRIVGRGTDTPRLQALAQKAKLNGAVRFLGHLSDADLKKEFAACRLFALPSEKEGFGLVYLEAMAHGKPCLGARAGGTPEVISPESGVLTPYGNIPALADACAHALRRTWNSNAIIARANVFSYPQFRDRLALLLAASITRK